MKINANTIKDYLDQLSDDRKSAISTLRKIRRLPLDSIKKAVALHSVDDLIALYNKSR